MTALSVHVMMLPVAVAGFYSGGVAVCYVYFRFSG